MFTSKGGTLNFRLAGGSWGWFKVDHKSKSQVSITSVNKFWERAHEWTVRELDLQMKRHHYWFSCWVSLRLQFKHAVKKKKYGTLEMLRNMATSWMTADTKELHQRSSCNSACWVSWLCLNSFWRYTLKHKLNDNLPGTFSNITWGKTRISRWV